MKPERTGYYFSIRLLISFKSSERLSDTNIDIQSILYMLDLNIFCVHILLYHMFLFQ